MNFAVTNVGTIILSCVPAVIGTLQTACGNYLIPYVALSGFAVVALIMTLIYKPILKRYL